MIRAIGFIFAFLFLVALAGTGGGLYLFHIYGQDLQDTNWLATYQPPTMTRVHAADGRLLAEYATERRVFVPVSAMPKKLIQAFLSAEDKNFYEHPGIDALGLVRAVLTNLRNIRTDRRPVGASTITQQVAKNLLLSSEVSIERKIKEAILAFRIEHALTKERILELYMNEIWLGYGSYGVAAAALTYFNKGIDDLSLAEVAYLAALPKAPSNYHPIRHLEAATGRRNWVLGRMAEDGVISESEATLTAALPLVTRRRDVGEFVSADYFAEEVRRTLYDRYGEAGLYEGGLSVRTTLDPRLQDIAERALRAGLIEYDRRHGWRGPLATIEIGPLWPRWLEAIEPPKGLAPWQMAVVLGLDSTGATIGLAGGERGFIPTMELTWARAWREGERIGPDIHDPSEVLTKGDVVAVEGLAEAPPGTFGLRQLPEIQGAIVAMDPHTGRVHAMVGGYSFEQSEFNRATQAMRQPGSAFKPFVYVAALENGFTPSSLVLDAPFVVDQGPGLGKWKPANYTRRFYGPSTLRLGIEKSRNLMTVRLAQFLGMPEIVRFARRFDIVDEMPPILSMSLGAGETTLMRLTAAYAMIANGGRRIQPIIIDRIQDRRGETVMRHDTRRCEGCAAAGWRHQREPTVVDDREQIIDESTAYQMVSMLTGVVQRGTGVSVRKVGRPLAGKTGTTNESRDAWFVGFSPDLVVGVYAGFDQPRSLGPREQGASVAAPIFRDFMAEALDGEPNIPFRIPRSVRLVRINGTSGLPAVPGDELVILEAYRPGTEPSPEAKPVLDGLDSINTADLAAGVGGLY
jgi:penicillin-binding protein 1A